MTMSQTYCLQYYKNYHQLIFYYRFLRNDRALNVAQYFYF